MFRSFARLLTSRSSRVAQGAPAAQTAPRHPATPALPADAGILARVAHAKRTAFGQPVASNLPAPAEVTVQTIHAEMTAHGLSLAPSILAAAQGIADEGHSTAEKCSVLHPTPTTAGKRSRRSACLERLFCRHKGRQAALETPTPERCQRRRSPL